MAIDNNVNLQQLSNQSQKNDILTKPQKYQVNPNAVDKTPDKDTVQLSSGLTTKEKVGIASSDIPIGQVKASPPASEASS